VRNRAEPTRIMNGQADAGITWASEVRFQESIGNPIQGIVIPTYQNTTAIYAGAVMADAPVRRLNRRGVVNAKVTRM